VETAFQDRSDNGQFRNIRRDTPHVVLRQQLGRVQAMIALLRTCNGREKSGTKSPKFAALAARSCYLIHIVQTVCE